MIVDDKYINFQLLRPSRKKLREGDVFVMLPPDGLYLFGRVIRVDLPSGEAPMPGSNLLYIYRQRAPEKELDEAVLDRSQLLLPPLYTNRLAWSHGYFETIANVPLRQADLLEQHSFLRASDQRYCDERGNVLPGPVEPAGSWGLMSYRRIDDLVSDALGIERAPLAPSDRKP